MPAAVEAPQQNHGKAIEELRSQARKKGFKRERTGPKLGTGHSVIKSQKEVAESELDQKIAENEERRRQWLMAWHIEVDQMQNDLYDMEKTLEKSLVRTESAKKRDKEKRIGVDKPQMTEEEIEKLPIRMRPRPKYKPYMTQKERSDINDHSFHKVIRNLVDNPRRFDAMTPDDYGTTSRFPQVQIKAMDSERYKILLLKNPFSKDTERNRYLMRSRTEFLQVPFRPGKPYFKQPSNVNTVNTARSADVNVNSDISRKLPSLKIPSMPDLRPDALSKGGLDSTLPRIEINKESSSNLSPVKEMSGKKEKKEAEKLTLPPSPSASKAPVSSATKLASIADNESKPSQTKKIVGAGKQRRSSSPTDSEVSSADSTDSHESGMLMAAKARRQKERTNKKVEENLALPEKNEPNLLDNAEFRKTLLQQMDEKRQQEKDEGQSNKWGLVKKKLGGMLKIKMPDVIKEAAKNKSKSIAIQQVEERIKQRRNSIAPGMKNGLSQSMTALDQINGGKT